jgi:uncharacterized protein
MSRKIRSSDSKRLLAGLFALAALLFIALSPATAAAQSLDAVRAAGTVGERYDGFLVLRDGGASGAVKSMVSNTNAQRKALYEKRSKEEKAPVAAIGKIYAQQIMQKAPKGTYFLNEAGKWTRK